MSNEHQSLRSEIKLILDEYTRAYNKHKTNPKALFQSGCSFTFMDDIPIETTSELTEKIDRFITIIAKKLPARRTHEKTLTDILNKAAHDYIANNKNIDSVITRIIDNVFDNELNHFEFLAPNYLFCFENTIDELRIGPVKAMQTAVFSAKRKKEHQDEDAFEIIPANEFSISFEPKQISMWPICWHVIVDASDENVEEEAKWLIDIAISYLRLTHRKKWTGLFPNPEEIEPHPFQKSDLRKETTRIINSTWTTAFTKTPCWYEINSDVVKTTNDSLFIAQSKLIFNPPTKSVAERIRQGLGWMTRGRQAKDRSERFLYFFTAIESLLSGNDKATPVTQTISRHAAVLLTNNNYCREKYAEDIRLLYNRRSALIHRGDRDVIWTDVNKIQVISENIFHSVLNKLDIGIKHVDFQRDLSRASYGMEYPLSGEN